MDADVGDDVDAMVVATVKMEMTAVVIMTDNEGSFQADNYDGVNMITKSLLRQSCIKKNYKKLKLMFTSKSVTPTECWQLHHSCQCDLSCCQEAILDHSCL